MGRTWILSCLAATALGSPPARGDIAGYLTGDPVGQIACYQLDTGSSRTSSVLRDGHGNVTVVSATATPDGAPAYAVTLSYAFDIALFGWESGSLTFRVPASYYGAAFMPWLREGNVLTGPDFSMAWLESLAATAPDGEAVGDADRLHIYDMHPESTTGSGAGITDLELWPIVIPQVPALGGVKIDLSASIYGFPFKAGIDFTEDQASCRTQ